MPLRAKLLLFLLPLVIGPLLGLGWLAYDRLRANAETALLREMETLLEQVALSEETHRSSALANANLFAGSALLKRYLFAAQDERIGFLLLPLLNLFASYHDAYTAYGDIRLIAPDGEELARYLADTPTQDASLIGLNDYLEDLRASDTPAIARYMRDHEGNPLLLIGRKLIFVDPIFEDNSFAVPSLRGFLLIAITPDHLRRQVGKGSFGQSGQIFFADERSHRLFPDHQRSAPRRLTGDLRQAIENAAATGRVQQTRQNGQPALVRARRLTPQLSLIALLPESELDAASGALGPNVALVAAIALALASGLLFAVLHYLVLQPVRRLEQGAVAIGGGDLEARVPVRGRDELARLASVFNHMANNLQASQKEKDQAQQDTLAHKQLAIDSLRKADKLKDEFLANTSHELRTPLHGIIGLAESLRAGVAGSLPPAANDNLRLIITSGRRLATLVNDILDFSRLRHRELRLHLAAVDVRAVADSVLQLVANLAEPKSIELINTIPADLPPALADENRLQQIFYNLIGNAIKFTDQGWVRVCAAVDDDQQIAIRICDTGPGIPPEQHSAVFASFEQLDGGAGRMHGGTGLGLAVTQSLVQALGGAITLESRAGAGACFGFTLPVADADKLPAPDSGAPGAEPASPIAVTEGAAATETTVGPPGPVARPAEATEGIIQELRGDNRLVLVVDDDPINRRVVSNQLSIQGFRVQTAADGEQALAWIDGADARQARVILLDVMMPRMNGFELCQKLRERFAPSELSILFLTARNQERDILQGFSVGANDYLPKPFSRGELIARVHTHASLVERTGSLRELTEELEQRVAARTRELEQAHAAMKRLAMRDGLTQVYNRRYFDEALAREWSRAQRHGLAIAVLMIDVDFFKQYNDSYGHLAGDQCLQLIGQILTDQARRGGDLVARYGGEEFCILAQHNADDALTLAERIRGAVAARALEHPSSGVAAHVTVSIGVAAMQPGNDRDPSELLAKADAALYRAKGGGRNRVAGAQRGEVS